LLQSRTDLNDAIAIARNASKIDLTLRPNHEVGWAVYVNGKALGEAELRSFEVEQSVSLVSAVSAVREHLREFQREIAGRGQIVIAGQDIGSVVLPDAELKVYLEASLEERVRRRSAQTNDQGDTQATLTQRSALDAARAVSPLVPAPDAHRINTDALTAEEVVDRIAALVQPSGT
jgi:cytidylate kinase